MDADQIDLYRHASAWTAEKASVASRNTSAPTMCDDWDVGTLLSHMVETQEYFAAGARGEEARPPSPTPSSLAADDPTAALRLACGEVLRAFQQPEAIEASGPALGIATADLLLHGWDLAAATSQDATMPDGLPQAALDTVYGRFTETERVGVFMPEIPVVEGAAAQDRLLGYTGRDPS